MTDGAESPVLDRLRHTRGRVDQIAEDVGELKHRMTSLEAAMSLGKREVVYGDGTDAH